jgi:hypothetical protein
MMTTWTAVSASRFMDHDRVRVWGIDLAAPGDLDFHHLDLALPSQLSPPPSNTRWTPWDSIATLPLETSYARKRRGGRIAFDLRRLPDSMSMPSRAPDSVSMNGTTTSDMETKSPQHEQFSLSTDSASTIHLIRLVAFFSFKFGTAFMGTLRLLAPLYVSRAPLNKSVHYGMLKLTLVSLELCHVGH